MYDCRTRLRTAVVLFVGTFALVGVASLFAAVDTVTAVKVSKDSISVQLAGRPVLQTDRYGRSGDYYFIVTLSHSILAGTHRIITVPDSASETVDVAQYTLHPAVVRLVVHSHEKLALPIETLHQQGNRYQVSLALRPRPPLKVFLDVGHGGYDPGGTGPEGLPESFVNLDVATRVAKILRSDGIGVELDRTGDVFVSLARRVELANRSSANLFLGLYCNASSDHSVHGTTTYYYHSNSYRFARYLETHVAHSLGLSDDGVMRDNLYVIRYTTTRMPDVLIEYAYISNLHEELLLTRSSFRSRVARAIADAVVGYFTNHPPTSSPHGTIEPRPSFEASTLADETARVDSVEASNGTVEIHSVGKPSVGTFSMQHDNVRYFVVNLKNAILGGHARTFQVGPPFSGRVTIDQFSVRPDVVRISVREDYANSYRVALDKSKNAHYVATIYPTNN